MGLMCSWVAIRTTNKSEVLEHLGLAETGRSVEPAERRKLMSAYQNDNGWLYVASADFDWADQARVLDLSRYGMTLAVQTEDKIDMECRIRAAEHGRELWAVAHINEPGQELTVSGDPPEILARIRSEYEAQQQDGDDVDYLWEIPLQLAREISGYRIDEDLIKFIELASTRAATERRSGLMSRILSVFR